MLFLLIVAMTISTDMIHICIISYIGIICYATYYVKDQIYYGPLCERSNLLYKPSTV